MVKPVTAEGYAVADFVVYLGDRATSSTSHRPTPQGRSCESDNPEGLNNLSISDISNVDTFSARPHAPSDLGPT